MLFRSWGSDGYGRDVFSRVLYRKTGRTHEVLEHQERIGAWAKSQILPPLVTLVVPAVAQRTNPFPRQICRIPLVECTWLWQFGQSGAMLSSSLSDGSSSR